MLWKKVEQGDGWGARVGEQAGPISPGEEVKVCRGRVGAGPTGRSGETMGGGQSGWSAVCGGGVGKAG